MLKERYLHDLIKEMCFLGPQKMAFIVGPRQTGKTTLARNFIKERTEGSYYNWDQREFRKTWVQSPQDLVNSFNNADGITPLLVLDEIHKSKLWKRTLKGMYDTMESRVDIVVTGSARLDTYKKGSDSLLGRYFLFHLHPLTLAEISNQSSNSLSEKDPTKILEQLTSNSSTKSSENAEALISLLKFGGFPEPFFSQSERRANAWRRMRLQQLVREDLRDLTRLAEMGNIELLMALLPERAGSQLSRSSLREDLEVAHTTVTRWLQYLSAIFYHFEIKPYYKGIKRSIKKEGKLYLWDYAEVPDRGHRFENLIAQHLLKACDYWTDSGYGEFSLNYLRNANGAEIDFIITKNKKPWLPVEVKLNDTTPSEHWKTFLPSLSCKFGIQVVLDKEHFSVHKINDHKVYVMNAERFLRHLI